MADDSEEHLQWHRWFERGHLKLRHLKVVLEVERMRSIGLAARELHLSQPAVTKAVQEVEAAAGMPLFERRSDGTYPTVIGQTLVRYAREVFGTLGRAGIELQTLSSGLDGHIAVGCNFPSAVQLLPLAVLQLTRANERIAVTLREAPLEVLLPELRTRQLDMLVARWPRGQDHADLQEHARFNQAMAVVAAQDHPLVAKGRANWKELGRCRWLMPPRGSAVRSELDELLRSKGLSPPTLRVESSSPSANALLVRELQAVTIVPRALLKDATGAQRLHPIHVPIPLNAFSPSSVITLQGRELRPAEQALIACLKAAEKTG